MVMCMHTLDWGEVGSKRQPVTSFALSDGFRAFDKPGVKWDIKSALLNLRAGLPDTEGP